MRLKRWESPRRQGRNDKGKGGSARQRQLKKLKGGESNISPLFLSPAIAAKKSSSGKLLVS
ncbi:MAG: hypothetical protein EWV40_18040 [Microcystis flos-aquae Mf_WU_F_19750830_S460]|uniref:Uncharacterized protein n=1 Tax=Microcystis flos-aquae Mf_WU_F_19750830_S460 TaxID=2486237 RepID=A0A552LCM2_9CHRO|nr:hypothetical protein [Microcystis aeruginosa]TRV17946.1 MAG: hypothetical protein EWV40_18040 [Microcystis flos-aquae Mf_WU_F_19750830_S460]